jgi:hypothetical protein
MDWYIEFFSQLV